MAHLIGDAGPLTDKPTAVTSRLTRREATLVPGSMRHSPKLTGLGSSGIGSDTIRPSGSTGEGLPPKPE
jgi:hypothetical protein